MPRGKRHEQAPRERDLTPAREDEEDILAEVGGEREEETGDVLVDEDKIREMGAADAASVIENRRIRNAVSKKKTTDKGARFNAGDLLTQYDVAVKVWTSGTMGITVRRLTGSEVTHTITTRPRSGEELYDAIMAKHGESEEALYEVRAVDSKTKEFRVNGRITLPDTRPKQQQQGQPMNPFYPNGMPQQQQPGYYPQQQQGYPPQQQQPAPQQQQPQATPAPQQPPQVYVAPPPAFDPSSMMGMMQEAFRMFQQVQASAQPPTPPPVQQFQYPPQAPTQPQMPPMPSPSATPQEMMAWMQDAFRMFQSMQAPQQPAQNPPAPQAAPQASNPMGMMGMMGAPPMQAPPGMVWTPIGLVPLERLVQAMNGGSSQEPPRRGPMHRSAAAPYYSDQEPHREPPPQGYGGPSAHRYAPPPQQQHQQPQQPLTPAEQFRAATSVIRTAVDMVREVEDLMPGGLRQQEEYAPPQASEEDEDSPVRVMDAGSGKLIFDKKGGGLRLMDTTFANMDKIFKFVGEQREQFQQHQDARVRREQAQQQQPRRQLPEGYVEVGPNYQPPPGYVAVVVDPETVPHVQPQQQYTPPPPQHQQQFPQAPSPDQMPPPIQSVLAPPVGQRLWGAPTFPDEGQGQ